MAFHFGTGGIRHLLNDKPAVGWTVAGLVLVAALVLLVSQVRGCGRTGGGGDVTKAYFTADDGKTWFADDAAKVPPIDSPKGKAVRARLFRCGGDGAPFVNHLEKYPDDVRRQIEQAVSQDPKNALVAFQQYANTMLVKRPGDADWVGRTGKPDEQRKFLETVTPHAKDCSSDRIEAVRP